MRRLVIPLLAAAALVAGCGSDDGDGTGAAAAPTPTSSGQQQRPAATPDDRVERKDIATDLAVPWGVAFLPGGDALVSERTTGRILRVPSGGGDAEEVMTVPGVDTDAGEGGLLGLAVSPDHADDGLVYAYYTTAADNRIARFELGGTPEPVLTGLRRGFIHNGGRIAFGPDGLLYAGVGDVGDPGLAQDRESLNGKVLRIEPDGAVPEGNPFGNEVFTYGHRNVQGLAWDGQDRLWASEFGQNRFDELNLLRRGANYGWPVVEGAGDTEGGRFVNPKETWETSEASPSGVAIVDGTLYMAALRGQGLWRVPLDGTDTGEPELLLDDAFGRLRTVVAAPGGGLWVATSNTDGRGSPRDGDDRIVQVPAP